jgi:hypothetical protein
MMFAFLWICVPCIQICTAFLPPIDSNIKWNVIRRDKNDNRQSSEYPRVLTTSFNSTQRNDVSDDLEGNDGDIENWESLSAELLLEDEDDGLNDGEWLSDKEEARLRLERQREEQRKLSSLHEKDIRASNRRIVSESDDPSFQSSPKASTTVAAKAAADGPKQPRSSPYTEDEEELIAAMGGKAKAQQRRREPGFLGDSTLMEICTDYSVPISYLADVLCMWDVPVPINVHDRLGDLVTGEQAFAILEAVNTLDVAALHDRYSNTNIQQLCYEWGIDLQQAFEMAMKEGWSLPFGVQTCLRVEQERELLRVLGSEAGLVELPDDDDYDDGYN